jgi:hypothetical protein
MNLIIFKGLGFHLFHNRKEGSNIRKNFQNIEFIIVLCRYSIGYKDIVVMEMEEIHLKNNDEI